MNCSINKTYRPKIRDQHVHAIYRYTQLTTYNQMTYIGSYFIEHHHYIHPLSALCHTRNHVLPTVFNLPKNHRPHYYHSSLYSNNQLRKKHNRSVLAFFFCQLCVCIGGQVCYLNYYSTGSCTSSTFLFTAITQSTINGLKPSTCHSPTFTLGVKHLFTFPLLKYLCVENQNLLP